MGGTAVGQVSGSLRWLAIKDAAGTGRHLFGSETTKTYETSDETITVIGALTVHRVTRVTRDRLTETLRVTGNPDDKVTISLGSPQSVTAVITGVTRL